MIKNKISLLLTTCLMHIITIEIFSQDYCKNICYCCKDICCGCLYNNNKKSEEELKEELEEEESNLTKEQERYFDDLLEDFDNNIRNFNDSIFSENSNSTNAEYTIVKDGPKGKDGILGEGAFGTVYKVKNKEGKIFALKKAFVKEKYSFTWKNEIQALIKCRKCKNVIKIVDVYKKKEIEKKYIVEDNGEVKGFYYYIITELYDHGDLLSYISSRDNSEIKKYYIILRRIIYQMINAVKQVHDKGIIHRDIKPDNFFIGENDKLYLGDFGCATENYDGISAGDFKYRCNHLLTYLETKGKGLKQDEKFNKLYKFLDIFALATSIFHFLTGRRFLAQIDYKDFINENITADKKWEQIIYDRFDEKDISGKLSIFRYTSEECEYNENVAFEEYQEPEEYKKLDSDFVTFLKKILLKFDFETFDVVTIDDLINSAFYQGLKSLVKEEKNLV